MEKVHVLEDEEGSDIDSGSEADVESDQQSDDGGDSVGDGEECAKKSGMADAMAKILGKQIQNKKNIIMAKGMTDKQIERKRKIKEHGGKDESISKKIHMDQQTRQAKKKAWENRGRVKPDPLDKPVERVLQRIATRGIVQLFNAVKQQQRLLDEQLVEAGASVRRKDKVVESMTKGKFLDILKGTAATKDTENISKLKQTKSEKQKVSQKDDSNDEEENSKWSILRDDFMMGGTMKDWDKEESDEEGPPED